MADADPVLCEIDGRGVASVTLNRPRVRQRLWRRADPVQTTPG